MKSLLRYKKKLRKIWTLANSRFNEFVSFKEDFKKNVTPILDRINTDYMGTSVESGNNMVNSTNSFESNGFMENTVISRSSRSNMSPISNTNELLNQRGLDNEFLVLSNFDRGNISTNTYHSGSQERVNVNNNTVTPNISLIIQPSIENNVDRRHSDNVEPWPT